MIPEIDDKIKVAMKAKEKERLQALRYLKSMLLENKTAKKPVAEMEVVIKHHKKLKDSLEIYPDDNPQKTLIAAEILVVAEFLPKQLEESEVVQIISDIKSKLESPNMGGIMKELSPQIKGKFDGKRASQLVQEALK